MSDFDTKENCFGQDIEEYLINRMYICIFW